MDGENTHRMLCSDSIPTQDSAADDFSFAVNTPATADNVTPPFPLFNRDLLPDVKSNPMELRSGSTSSTSSSGTLDIDPDSYCVWNADRACKKSASTGSRSRPEVEPELGSDSLWRIIMGRRSISNGKDRFEYVRTVSISGSGSGSGSKLSAGKTGKKVDAKEMDLVTAHKLFYGKEKNEKKTFLPYKQDIVGLWSSNRGSPFNR